MGGIKHTDLKPCLRCGKGVMHDGNPIFYRVKLETFCVDVGAVNRAHGLEMMMGNPIIAFTMGQQEDLAKPLGEPVEGLLCQPCALQAYTLPMMLEM